MFLLYMKASGAHVRIVIGMCAAAHSAALRQAVIKLQSSAVCFWTDLNLESNLKLSVLLGGYEDND